EDGQLWRTGDRVARCNHRHGNDPLLLSLIEFCCLVERTLERQLEIKCNRRRFRFGAVWIATLPRLELIFPWRTARAHPVVRVRRNRLRGSRRNRAPASACAVLQLVGGPRGRREGSSSCHEPLRSTEIHFVGMSFLSISRRTALCPKLRCSSSLV